jgi:multidrug efflux pump
MMPPSNPWARSPAPWWGIATVLTAVFLPMAFFGGSTGVIYRQFSITIISAMILSVLVAMILTPALCSTTAQTGEKGHHPGECGWFCKFFRWFNRWFDAGRGKYEGLLAARLISRSVIW